jgi:3',5'-cyclic AMP phosphodiesterase CpdA
MINIAHISDIHFGNNFSRATWDAVVDVVAAFDPHLVVVSGDLVDDPAPVHLLSAKCALADLMRKIREKSDTLRDGNGRNAELIVVPGNHDVFESGLAVGMRRIDWFERIFHGGDTASAETMLKTDLGVASLGFDTTCLDLAGKRPQDAGWARKLQARLGSILSGRSPPPSGDYVDFRSLIGRAGIPPRVCTPASAPVLLAMLDSNPRTGISAATGLVDNDDLLYLQGELRDKRGPYVARIAIVHHHVLPIAFASGGTKKTGEPMMVLRNAGAVLRILADAKFDLILHGHWHKSQFAKIDFGSDAGDSYPISVVSAGSAAMTEPDNTNANSINLIRIAATGRIEVKSVDYGAAQAPNPNGKSGQHYRLYLEPLSSAKRRAYARARERHPIECEKRVQFCELTENGDLWVTHQVEGLQIVGDLPRYPRRPFVVYLPPYGHFAHETLKLDDNSLSAGAELKEAPDYPRHDDASQETESYWIHLPRGGLAQGHDPVGYTVSHGCANCMLMTRWEARERIEKGVKRELPPGYDQEWIAMRVSYPTRTLELKIKFPSSLVAVQPRIEVRRLPQYPLYRVDDWGDAVLQPKELEIDPTVQDEEEWDLRYDARHRTWILRVDCPLVGYQYALRWQVPGETIDLGISGNTREWRSVLLNLGSRIDAGTATADDREAIKQFDLLCEALQVELCGSSPDERWTIALFVHDSAELALRPVFSRRSWSRSELPRSFKIPYGDGVSGAAFQQRRIIAWNSGSVTNDLEDSAASLITPVPYPEEKADERVNVLAVPFYHSGWENIQRPPPWTTIGVVTFDSSSHASPINGMDDTQRRRLRAAVQAQADIIVQALKRKNTAAAVN